MADTASLKVRAEAADCGKFKKLLIFLREWAFRNKIYFLAFAIPAIIMYIAYAMFGLYPFGGESVLVLDLNGQYVYYFEALRDAFWSGDESIFYDWSRNLSGGYAGIIGYYLASPFTLIVMLLPRTMMLGALLILQLAKLGSAGLTFCYFLRKSKGLSELQAVVFSTLYALCAYGVIQLIDPMWLDGLVLLPLITLGVEYLVDDGRKINYIIPLALMFIANFYIGYMIGIFTFIYFVFYTTCGCKNAGRKKRLYEIWQSFVRMALATIVALACAAVMLLPVVNALGQGKFSFTENPDYSYSTQFKPLDFLSQLTVAQYDSVNVQGLPEIYCGILTLFLAPLFFLNKEIKPIRKLGYMSVLIVLFLCMYINPIDMAWHGFQEPNWLPYRYSFTFSFVLLCMAAETFGKLDGLKPVAIGGTLGGVLLLLLVIESGDLEHITSTNIWICAGLAVVYCGIVLLANKFGKKFMAVAAPCALLVVSGGELLYNAYQTLLDEDVEICYSERKSWYNYINNGKNVTNMLYDFDDSIYRAEKTNTYYRTVNDNSAFGLRGLSHSSSVMNAKIITFLEAMGYDTGGFESSYNGASPIIDSILGIKYVMDRNYTDKIGTEDYTRKALSVYDGPVFSYEYTDEEKADRIVEVYNNPYALSPGFMADESIRSISFFGNDNPFKAQNTLMSCLVGKTNFAMDITDPASHEQYYKQLVVDPDQFTLNNVNLAYTTSSTGAVQYLYTALEGDPTVDMFITPETDNPVYMFFKTESRYSVNLWLSKETDDTGTFINHDFVQSYFKGHDYHIVELGSFEPGETFNLRMTVADEQKQAVVKDFFFYEFDEELFAQDMAALQANQWQIDEFEGDYLKGTITSDGGKTFMLTSIPYEEGWTVKVDGETVEHFEVAQALIGIPVGAGTHTVEMSYTPPGFSYGLILFVIGVAAIVVIYRYDRKNNKVLIAMYREKKQAATAKPVKSNTAAKSADETEKTESTGADTETAAKTKKNKKKKK